MEEKKFLNESKKVPFIAITIIVAIVSGFIGSTFSYIMLDKKIDKLSGKSTNTNIEYKINEVDNPVVAIASKAGPSIVGVRVSYLSQNMFGSLNEADEEGSGIIYKENGYIITNYHVIKSAIKNSTAKVVVTLPNSEDEYEATIIGHDETTDLAVIKIDKTGLTPAEIGKSSDLKVGELAVAIGNPLGQEFAGSVTGGYISALNRKVTTDGRTYKLIQTDAAINPGNSGGALVNSKGQVIGINTVKVGSSSGSATTIEGLGFAIPTDDAIPIIEELITNKKIVRPYIGISGITLDKATAKLNNLVVGAYIAQVVNESPAQKAGLQKGDVIISVEGTTITSMEELNNIKNTKKIGDVITIKINRTGKEMDMKVTLASDENTNT